MLTAILLAATLTASAASAPAPEARVCAGAYDPAQGTNFGSCEPIDRLNEFVGQGEGDGPAGDGEGAGASGGAGSTGR